MGQVHQHVLQTVEVRVLLVVEEGLDVFLGPHQPVEQHEHDVEIRVNGVVDWHGVNRASSRRPGPRGPSARRVFGSAAAHAFLNDLLWVQR